MKEKVSIIVPIYNVESFLKKCIDSILKQTYQNFELILVNDGSTDNCPAICDKYAKKYRQVRVIHKENGGLSSARNAGLDISTGELILFVDSDDFIEKDMLLKLYKALELYNADMAICNLRHVNIAGKYMKLWPDHIIKDECIDNMQYWDKVFEDYGILFYVVAWNKLYRKRLWEKLRYPVGKINEDAYILHELVSKCSKIACTSYIGYNYVQRSNSIMRQKEKNVNFDLLEAWLGRVKYFNSIQRMDLSRKEISEYLAELINMYSKCHSENERNCFRMYYEKYKTLYSELYWGIQEPLKEKIKRIGCEKNPRVVYVLMQIYRFYWFRIHKWIH